MSILNEKTSRFEPRGFLFIPISFQAVIGEIGSEIDSRRTKEREGCDCFRFLVIQ